MYDRYNDRLVNGGRPLFVWSEGTLPVSQEATTLSAYRCVRGVMA